jgi:hypothetical protein
MNRFETGLAIAAGLGLDPQYKGGEVAQRELRGRRDSLPPAQFSLPKPL